MAQPYVLPNRKAFADSIVRIFLKYKNKAIDPLDLAETEEDLCKRQGDMSKNSRELLEHQKVVRDYLLSETPYRGLLLYHGLGSGKTCSSIAVAESLLSTRVCYVLLPAALQDNYRKEIRKCGDPIFKFEQYWEPKSIRSLEDRELGLSMGISEKFLDENGRFYVTSPTRQPNYELLSRDDQKRITAQLDDVLNQRFKFINYNGLDSRNVDKILPPDNPDMFDNTTVVIDEAHNLIGYTVNDRQIKRKLYDMIYKAKNCKVVLLSGTPIVNRPVEIAFMMNLIRGPIERVEIPTKQAVSWDEGLMTSFFRKIPDVDTIEYNAVNRAFLLTRNPPYFESVYNEKGERIAVKYSKDLPFEADIKKWVSSWKTKFETEFGGIELENEDKYKVEELECLPTDPKKFGDMFIDGLNIKNPMVFAKRIQGLVSYFKTADERLLPKEVEPDNRLVKIPMSDEQFLRYLESRSKEIKLEARRTTRRADINEDYGSYRLTSRLVCNYAIPRELQEEVPEGATENKPIPVEASKTMESLRAEPDKYFSDKGLAIFSPKMLALLKEIKANIGNPGSFNNQFIYSYFLALQGLGIFAEVLKFNGFQEYKIIEENGVWKEDPEMKPDVPAFAFYTGEDDQKKREYMRQIFNGPDESGRYESGFPPTLKDSIKTKRLCVLMATKAGAEGIDLKAVKNVYIMEPYWNPALIDQAIGRAIRICSHAKLPLEDRTVKVKIYMDVFTPSQTSSGENDVVLIRRNDTDFKLYEGDKREAFMTSDEFLYNISYKKNRIIKSVSHILKQAAIDCEIHRKLHSKEQPVIQCLRFDSKAGPEDLAFKPNITGDERDTLYMRNVRRRARRLQIIKAKGIALLLDPDTSEIFDLMSFEDTKRLIKLGIRTAPGEIRFYPPVATTDFSSKR